MMDTTAGHEPLLHADRLAKSYRLGEESIPALVDVELRIPRGQFAAIMGASGSGKTTLLHLVGGLDVPDSGRVVIAGEDLTCMADVTRTLFRRRRLGIVFQAFNLLPTLTALENVMLPLLIDRRPTAEARSNALALLERVHLGHRLKHRPAALSGGEQQRVAIARALINDPLLLLADEPTGNLDPKSSHDVLQLLRGLSRQSGVTVLMVTHEPEAASHADIIHVLKSGRFTGCLQPETPGDASSVATRYAQLAN
jgi:putative ABC transport system ATP-binding protein